MAQRKAARTFGKFLASARACVGERGSCCFSFISLAFCCAAARLVRRGITGINTWDTSEVKDMTKLFTLQHKHDAYGQEFNVNKI